MGNTESTTNRKSDEHANERGAMYEQAQLPQTNSKVYTVIYYLYLTNRKVYKPKTLREWNPVHIKNIMELNSSVNKRFEILHGFPSVKTFQDLREMEPWSVTGFWQT